MGLLNLGIRERLSKVQQQDMQKRNKGTVNTCKYSTETSGSQLDATRHSRNNSGPINMDMIHTSANISEHQRCFHCFHSSWSSWCLQQLWAGLQSSHQLRRHPRLALPRCVQNVQNKGPTWANIHQIAQSVSKGPNATPQDSLDSWIFTAPLKVMHLRFIFAFWAGTRNFRTDSTANVGLAQRGKMLSTGHVEASAKLERMRTTERENLMAHFQEKQTGTSCDCYKTICLILLQLLHPLHGLLNLPQIWKCSPLILDASGCLYCSAGGLGHLQVHPLGILSGHSSIADRKTVYSTQRISFVHSIPHSAFTYNCFRYQQTSGNGKITLVCSNLASKHSESAESY